MNTNFTEYSTRPQRSIKRRNRKNTEAMIERLSRLSIEQRPAARKISKQRFVFEKIIFHLPEIKQVQIQLLSKKFYDKIVPYCLEAISIRKSSEHAQVQKRLYSYFRGFLMYKELSQIGKEGEQDWK